MDFGGEGCDPGAGKVDQGGDGIHVTRRTTATRGDFGGAVGGGGWVGPAHHGKRCQHPLPVIAHDDVAGGGGAEVERRGLAMQLAYHCENPRHLASDFGLGQCTVTHPNRLTQIVPLRGTTHRNKTSFGDGVADKWQQRRVTDSGDAFALLAELLLDCGIAGGPFGDIDQGPALVIATTKHCRAGLFINGVYHAVATVDDALR